MVVYANCRRFGVSTEKRWTGFERDGKKKKVGPEIRPEIINRVRACLMKAALERDVVNRLRRCLVAPLSKTPNNWWVGTGACLGRKRASRPPRWVLANQGAFFSAAGI